MVHRKSTYKLAFKNLSKDIRKSIWEENSILRERRRTSELSHHSIEECDDSCDCDSPSTSDEEDEQVGQVGKKYCDEEEEEEEEEGQEDDDDNSDKHSEKESKKTAKQYVNGYCKYRKFQESPNGHLESPSPLKDTERIYKKYKDGTQIKKTKILERKRSPHREKLFTDRKYASETDLDDLLRSLSTKGKRGVMKYSKATGEFDLIPARLQNVNKDKGKDTTSTKNKPTRQSSVSDQNIINIRPRIALKSLSRPASSRGRPLSSKDRVTFSDDDLGRGSKLELRSSRKEPRLGSSGKEGNVCMGMQSLCSRCGQEIKHRGILT